MKYEYKIGDRVQYNQFQTGNSGFSSAYAGRKATVLRDLSADSFGAPLRVRMDGETYDESYNVGNFTKIDSVEGEIEKALAVLAKHGKVEFKKNKPPFQNILVGGVGDYTATVMERFIIVGCQTITLDKFDELAAAVAKARAYTKEN